jgi:carboxylesterase
MPMREVGAAALALVSAGAWWTWSWRRRVASHFEVSDASRRPLDAQGVVRGAEALHLEADTDRAVLVLHGFNDTPQSMAYLAGRLHAAGYTVLVPRLPGHGRALRDMAREAHASAWLTHVRACHAELRARHARVYLCGQSMGGALAVLQAVTHPDTPALALLAPFLGMPDALQWQALLSAFSPAPYFRSTGGERSIHDPDARRQALGPGIVTSRMLRGLRQVALHAERVLGQVTVPTLYLQSRHDNRIEFARAERCFGALAVSDKSARWLEGSGHIVSADYERDLVADAVIDWFARHP